MTSSVDSDLQKVAELLLERRLREHENDLDERRDELEEEVTGPMTREPLVNAWAGALELYCERTLTDLIGILRNFGVLSSAEWIRNKFASHVDQAAARLIRRLAASSIGGRSSASAERNQIINLASRIKAQADVSLNKEIDRALKERESTGLEESLPDELDDRLPLARRGAFDRDLVAMVEASGRSEEPLSLTMIDLDHFKSVNDEHGHPVGDEVLLAVSELVIKRVGRKGKAYRYGGEELALLLPNYSVEEAFGLAERLRKDIEEATISSKALRITASFGVACFPEHASDPKAMLEKADHALYEAKNQGRNCVCVSGARAGGR